MDVEVFVTDGLGDSSYLVRSGDEAALVDPQRDAWRFLRAAERTGARIRAVLETHVHNDYVSGAGEVHAATGAEVVAPAAGGYRFPHHPAAEGDEVRVGDLRLVAMATPGHTPEHLAWLAHEGEAATPRDRKSTRLNSSHVRISYAVFCLKKKTTTACRICPPKNQNYISA